MGNRPKSVRVFVRGGLGNQLHSLAAGLVAAHTRGANLIVDGSVVSRSTEASRLFQLDKLEIEYGQGLEVEFRNHRPGTHVVGLSLRKASYLLSRVTGSRIVYWYSHERELAQIADPRKAPRLLDGHFEGVSCPKVCFDLGLIASVKLSGETSAMGNEIRQARNPQSVAVHVRLGDFVTTRPDLLLGEGYYRAALHAVEYVRGREILLFSDELSKAQQMLLRAGAHQEDIYALGGCSAAEDLVRMSSAHTMILSHSSLAWWAAKFSHGDIIVAPTGTAGARSNWILLDGG